MELISGSCATLKACAARTRGQARLWYSWLLFLLRYMLPALVKALATRGHGEADDQTGDQRTHTDQQSITEPEENKVRIARSREGIPVKTRDGELSCQHSE